MANRSRLLTSLSGIIALAFTPLVMLASPMAWGQTRSIDQQLAIPLDNLRDRKARNRADFFLEQSELAKQSGNLNEAIAYLSQAGEIYQQIGDFEGLGKTYNSLGQTYAKLGRYQEAERALRRGLGAARSQQSFQPQIYSINNIGILLLQTRNLKAAQEAFMEALTISRTIKDDDGEGLSLNNLGLVAAQGGNYPEAIKWYEAALVLRRRSR
ncbi:MAG: tetratricopeptide repeat protein, partial [Moorea sp. SIO4G2]|nr:tetratricopeptide repeat protein [Moorena sp. SIO4G2]